MRIPVQVPVALSAGESRGSGVAHWIEGNRLLIRTRFPLRAGQALGFALIPTGFPDRIIGGARVLEEDPDTAARAPGWVCEIDRISPEMRATLTRWRATLQAAEPAEIPAPAPPVEAPKVESPGLRFQPEPEDSVDPDTAVSESTVARTMDSSADTAVEESEKVGRRALRGAVARSAVGRRTEPPPNESDGGPLWLTDLDKRLRASGLDEAASPPPTRAPSNPFADLPTHLADDAPWSGSVQQLEGDDPSTEIEKSPFDEDDPTQVFEEPDASASNPTFALIADEIVEESEAESRWSVMRSHSSLNSLSKPDSVPPGPATTTIAPLSFHAADSLEEEPPLAESGADEELPDPFADMPLPNPFDDAPNADAGDPFADLLGPPPAARDPFAPPPAATPAPPVTKDWLAELLAASPAPSGEVEAVFDIDLPDGFDLPPLPPPEPQEEDYAAAALLMGEEEPPTDLVQAPARFEESSIKSREPAAPAAAAPPPSAPAGPHPPIDVNFRYNTGQRMLEVSWRTAKAFGRDHAEQLEHKVLRVWTHAMAADGDLITIKLALPDGQVLAMQADVIGTFSDGFDIEIRMPKPAQQKLRRAAQGH